MTTPLISADGVSFSYGEKPTVDGVSLEVHAGQILSLIGPNGAGKSTLLGLLSGDLSPSSGKIHLAGREIERWSSRERAQKRAVMEQKSEVNFSYLVREIVAMGRSPWIGRTPGTEDEKIIDNCLQRAGLEALAHRYITQLSGGECARTHLARVLAQQTPVLLLDEPTAALDIAHQEQIMGEFHRLRQAGCAIIAVVHDLNLAAAYSDRIVLLHNGAVAARGTPEEVLTSATLSTVYGCEIDVLKHPETSAPIIIPARRQ